MDHEEAQRKFEERNRKQNIIIIQSVLTTLQFIFQRQKNIDDPVLRSCLFIEKISMAIESVICAAQTALELEVDDDKLPQSTIDQITNLRKILREELDVLMTYCRMPSYSPDAPFGAHVVEETTVKFCRNASKNDSSASI